MEVLACWWKQNRILNRGEIFMQTLLGAGGGAGTEISRELSNYTKEIRIVNRNPKKVNDTDQLLKADLTDPKQLDDAVKGSEIVYVTIAFLTI